MVTKSERISNILKKKLLEKIKSIKYFDASVNRDGIKEDTGAKTFSRNKCYHK